MGVTAIGANGRAARLNSLRKNSRMCAPPWKTGPSELALSLPKGPRKKFEISAGFRVCVRTHFRTIQWNKITWDPAPEGRPSIAQRFSAGKIGKNDSSQDALSRAGEHLKPVLLWSC